VAAYGGEARVRRASRPQRRPTPTPPPFPNPRIARGRPFLIVSVLSLSLL
jgi:hypothetical protein